MKLIRLHVENFGCLHDITLDFQDGLNVLCRGNGWGKSTVAALIRVMFYGFLGESRRDDISNERRRYRPWKNSGTYGGWMIFEAGGRTYRAVRSFGARPKEDTFALYDERTGLPSRDYTRALGEELFRIDAVSFARTVFTGQMDAPTGATSMIHAKIGGTSLSGDAGSYADAQARIHDEINHLSADRKTGKISILSREIEKLGADLPGEASLAEKRRSLAADLAADREEFRRITTAVGRVEEKTADLADRLEGSEDLTEGRDTSGGEKPAADHSSRGTVLILVAGLAAVLAAALILRFVPDPQTARLLLVLSLIAAAALAVRGVFQMFRGGRSSAGAGDNSAALTRELIRMSRERDSLLDKKDELSDKIRKEGHDLADLEDELLGIDREKQEIAAKKEERDRLCHRLEILTETSAYLEKAMQGFSARYVRPVGEAFARYYQLMTGEKADSFRIDVDLGLKVMSGGALRDSGCLSAGFKDLTGLCLRLALVDAMYPNEKPFLIFDDPFVSLDDEKRSGAMRFLKAASAEHQVIFFTCRKITR